MHMGHAYFSDDKTRADIRGDISQADVAALLKNTHLEVIQFSKPVGRDALRRLDADFFSRRPAVALRAWGFERAVCDLGVAAGLKHVRHFKADCLTRAVHVEAIAEMPNLRSLWLGILDLETFDVLTRVTPGLTEIMLGETRSRKPDLQVLSRFKRLRVLYLDHQIRNIEVLGELSALERLTLRCLSTPDVAFLKPLSRLWSLAISLGGIKSLSGLEGMSHLKDLDVQQVQKLADVGVVSTLRGLQHLRLDSLRHITAIPRLDDLRALRRIVLINLKGLSDLRALERAPGLKEFYLAQGTRQEPEQMVPVLRNRTLERATALFDNNRKNERFARLRDEHGKLELPPLSPFEHL
jgi:hypothetical protein